MLFRPLPLPITLLSFTGRLLADNTVLLNWATTSETNNRYFAVARSANGTDFDSIGTVTGAGTTYLQQNYSFTDPAPLSGMNYYRLKQVDGDGHSTYSPVVSVSMQPPIVFSAVPNPVHDLLTINMGAALQEKGLFRVIGMDGRIVLAATATMDNVQQLSVSGLAPGAYILQYITAKNSSTIRFVKF